MGTEFMNVWGRNNSPNPEMEAEVEQALYEFRAAVRQATPPGRAKPTLSLGASGPFVVELQDKLNLAKVTEPEIPRNQMGRFDERTRRAVIRFQRITDLAQDGIVGPQTWGALDSSAGGVAVSDTDKAEIRARVGQAVALFEQDRFEESLALFRQVHFDPRMRFKARPQIAMAINIGLVLQRMEQFEQAISWYMEALSTALLSTHERGILCERIREARERKHPTDINVLLVTSQTYTPAQPRSNTRPLRPASPQRTVVGPRRSLLRPGTAARFRRVPR